MWVEVREWGGGVCGWLGWGVGWEREEYSCGVCVSMCVWVRESMRAVFVYVCVCEWGRVCVRCLCTYVCVCV